MAKWPILTVENVANLPEKVRLSNLIYDTSLSLSKLTGIAKALRLSTKYLRRKPSISLVKSNSHRASFSSRVLSKSGSFDMVAVRVRANLKGLSNILLGGISRPVF